MNEFKKNIYKQNINSCILPTLNNVIYTATNLVTFDFNSNSSSFDYSMPNGDEIQYSVDNGMTWQFAINQSALPSPGLQGGTIPNVPNGTTILYKIVLNYSSCINLSSNIITDSWQGNNLTNSAPQQIVPAQYSNPKTANSNNICSTGNQWTTSNIGMDTSTPQVGTQLFVYNTGLPAIPGNMSAFDNVAGSTFNVDGIKWIRIVPFSNDIFDVNPSTGIITGVSSTFTCP